MEELIPLPIKRFIILKIDSVELLNVLLLLQRSAERVWTNSEIEHELRSSRSAIQKRLNDLYLRKVLRKNATNEDAHSYLPYTPELADVIQQVADFNQTHQSRVIELIYSRKDESLKSFADAFRIKEDQ
jgi:predicted transcriptional regulator